MPVESETQGLRSWWYSVMQEHACDIENQNKNKYIFYKLIIILIYLIFYKTDASDFAIGAVLGQNIEGEEYPIPFASAKLVYF